MPQYAWLDYVALAAFVSAAMQIVKPTLEQFVPPSAKAHDLVLQLLLLLLNFAGVLYLAAQSGHLSWSAVSIAGYVILAAMQAGGGHVAYGMFVAGKQDVQDVNDPSASADGSSVAPPAAGTTAPAPDPTQPPNPPTPPGGVSLLPPADQMPTQMVVPEPADAAAA